MCSISVSITLGKKAWKSRVNTRKQMPKFLLTNVRSNARDSYYFLSSHDGNNWKELLPKGACSAFQCFWLNVKFIISSKEPETTTTTITTKQKTRKTAKRKRRTYFSLEAQIGGYLHVTQRLFQRNFTDALHQTSIPRFAAPKRRSSLLSVSSVSAFFFISPLRILLILLKLHITFKTIYLQSVLTNRFR